MYDPANLNEPLPSWVEWLSKSFLLVAGGGCLLWAIIVAREPDLGELPFASILAVLGLLPLYLALRLVRHQRLADTVTRGSPGVYTVTGLSYLGLGLLLIFAPDRPWYPYVGAVFILGAGSHFHSAWRRRKTTKPPHAA